jgi:hypothetical protein
MSRRTSLLAVAPAAIALVIAGCGGSSSSGTAASATTNSSSGSTSRGHVLTLSADPGGQLRFNKATLTRGRSRSSCGTRCRPALTAACLAVAARLTLGLDRWAWAAVLGLALVPIAGYILSRTTGLPGAADDVGDWADPLGLASLAVEVALVPLAMRAAPRVSRPERDYLTRSQRRVRSPRPT